MQITKEGGLAKLIHPTLADFNNHSIISGKKYATHY
jgi:hypothetical protein